MARRYNITETQQHQSHVHCEKRRGRLGFLLFFTMNLGQGFWNLRKRSSRLFLWGAGVADIGDLALNENIRVESTLNIIPDYLARDNAAF